MKKIMLLSLCLIMVLAILVSCAETSVKEEPAPAEKPETEKPVEKVKEETTKEPVQVQQDIFDSKVKELLDKGRKVDNYQYLIDISTRNKNGLYDGVNYQLYRKAEKVRKGLLKTVLLDDGSYTDIYLDTNAKTAHGSCLEQGVTCKGQTKLLDLDYAALSDFVTPNQLIEEIPASAEEIGTGLVGKRKVLVIEYQEGDTIVQVSIDQFYGIPLKRIVFGFVDDEKTEFETILFDKLAVNSIKNADVNP